VARAREDPDLPTSRLRHIGQEGGEQGPLFVEVGGDSLAQREHLRLFVAPVLDPREHRVRGAEVDAEREARAAVRHVLKVWPEMRRESGDAREKDAGIFNAFRG
jgi:hypothetical protein